MTERRRGLGRGLGALIPSGPEGERPRDVFWPAAERGEVAVPAEGTDGGSPAGAAPAAGATGDDARSTWNSDAAAGAHGDEALVEVPGLRLTEVPVGAVRPNPRQPRQVFDEDELAELEQSIREVGVLQPVVVRPVPAGEAAAEGVLYELVMGERRWRASRRAGLDVVPAIVRGTEDDVLLRDALLENLHRSQLNPLEEAAAYGQLLEDFGCTHEELARRIGRSRPQISNTLRLLKLPPLVQRRVAAGVLSAGHARALLGLPDAAAMERLAQRVVAEGLSVRSTEEAVAAGDAVPAPRRSAAPAARDERADAVATALSERLETRVTVNVGRRKGRLTVEFAGREDLERILGVLALEGVPSADGGGAA
ncbi:ParB/RepB/Spo0J family partition protein [uncultured Pseudokineococcus sp.]|uniref:ParB/RepB/Spo0J family partition protein n=1 Tax=uncultured Pseudokineococcus sp. TaxID=1642928 RepID=UPI00260B9EEA|nr:ParB/RepB/Spo0J family partition protein [uncultured Pseudokineococcus sp.]